MEKKGRNRKPEFFRQNASRGDVCTDSPSPSALRGRTYICHKFHKLYLWRKNCHVEKFWENLRHFGKFWEILPQFTRFHVEKNWAQKVHLWRKNDKYEVWKHPFLISFHVSELQNVIPDDDAGTYFKSQK